MSTRRSYQDACAASHALDLIGERWALLVVRELLLGPKRFTDLKLGLPGISPNVLTQRLTELEEAQILQRRKLPPPASAWIYELTPWGLDLKGVIMALGRWAVGSPGLKREVPMGVDSVILSFLTMFDPSAVGDLQGQLELRFGADRFRATVADGQLDIVRGNAPRPDVVVTTDPTTLTHLVYGPLDLDTAIASGALQLEGDRAIFEKFKALFPKPTPPG